MKRLFKCLILFLLFISGCSSNKMKVNVVENGLTVINIDNLPYTVGKPYYVNSCISESGYCVTNIPSYELPLLDNEIAKNILIQNFDFYIYYKEKKISIENTIIYKYEYFINDYEKDYFLYEYEKTYDENSKVFVFETKGNIYFAFIEEDRIIINVIEDNNLIKMDSFPIEINSFKFNDIQLSNNNYILKYQNNNELMYLIENEYYYFSSSDHIAHLKDGMLVSEYKANQVISTYYIDYYSSKKIPIDQALDMRVILSNNNQFIYSSEGSLYYATVQENNINVYNLNIKTKDLDLISLTIVNDYDLIYVQPINENLSFDLIKINK